MAAPFDLSNLPQGTETILLVDDDESVLQVVSSMLQKLGYEVLTATNGIAALQICSRHPREIHLLLTDISMKPLDGFHTASAALELRRNIQILFHSADPIQLEGIPDGYQFLQKPFRIEALAQKIRKVLDG